MAAQTLHIGRDDAQGRYIEMLDVIERLGKKGLYGSNTNAAFQLIQQSPQYQETLALIRAESKPIRRKATA